jgi:hypothetical protein
MFSSACGKRSPCILIPAAPRSISPNSSAVSSIAAADVLLDAVQFRGARYRRDPRFCASSHASAI